MWNDTIETQDMAGTERLSVIIPSDLKLEFEALCKLERRSMSAQVVLLIEQAVQEAKDQGRLTDTTKQER